MAHLWWVFPLKIVMFDSYVSLPEGKPKPVLLDLSWWFVYQQFQAQDRIDWGSPEISNFLASDSITTHPNSTTMDISHGRPRCPSPTWVFSTSASCQRWAAPLPPQRLGSKCPRGCQGIWSRYRVKPRILQGKISLFWKVRTIAGSYKNRIATHSLKGMGPADMCINYQHE